jgi:hypothetical protein
VLAVIVQNNWGWDENKKAASKRPVSLLLVGF